MKKVYLLLAMLLGSFGLVGSYAQPQQFDFEKLSKDGYTVDGDNPLITDAFQFSSPYSQNDLGGQDGGNLADGVLIDEDASSFWHSYWGGGDVAAGTHYFQVELPDDVDPDALYAFVFTRRNASNDHTIVWSVRGTDDPEAAKNECEEVAYVETPYGSSTETLMSTPFKIGEWKYLRFYSEQQQGSGYGSRGYFHLSEFNIFPAHRLDELEVAIRELEETYKECYAHYDDFYGRTGTMPGDFSEDAVLAFQEACDAYLDVDFNDIDAIKACSQNMKDTYAAIAATKVPFKAASGYYFIKAGMAYNDGLEKYMCVVRSDDKFLGYWASPDFDIAEDAIQVLWKVTAVTDTTYRLVNMYSDAQFTKVTTSANIELSTESDSLVAFDAVATDHNYDISYINIRLAAQPGSDGTYLHQNGHSNGDGTANTLVGWYNTWSNTEGPKASEWYLEEVPEDEALEIIAAFDKEADAWKSDFKTMMKNAPGMLEIAKDVQKRVDRDKPLISDENPIVSPCSDESEGQHIEYLWDGKADNFWHSDWHGAFTAEDHHYIQVEITDPETYASSVFTFIRRNTTSGNQINKWTIWGTNEEDDLDAPFITQESGELELLAEVTTPWTTGVYSEAISDVFETKGYKYIRFYCAGTCNNDGTQGGNEKFMHLAEFQVYPGEIYQSPTNQYSVLGDVATNLEQLINEFADIAEEDLDKNANYLPLKAAYDAFIAKYVDPSDLRAAIDKYKNKTANVIVGKDPGFWPNSSTADALDKTIADAKAYDEAGAYLPATSEKFIADMDEQSEAIDAAPNKIQEGKWYRIRFGTEEEFKTYGWPTGGNEAYYRVIDGDTIGDLPYHEAIFGKYLTAAKWVAEEIDIDEAGDPVNAAVVTPIDKADAAMGTYIYCDDLEDIEDPDMALFRFVNIGDSAYAIQNKATGLYFQRPYEGGDVRLGIYPALYEQKVIGWGQNSFFSKTIQGNTLPPLHQARNYNVLTQWGGSTSGWGEYDNHRGAFYVEEVEDVAAGFPVAGNFKIKDWAGATSLRCYPVTVTALNAEEGQMWTVASIERTAATEGANEQVKITLGKIQTNVADAGRPFIYVMGGDFIEAEDRDEDAEPEVAEFSFVFDLTTTPQTEGVLKGVFDQVTVGQGAIYLNADGTPAITGSNANIASNAAYITEGETPFDRKAEIEVISDAGVQDGINTAIQNVSRMGGIYTVDGRFVKNGNLNTISNLPKGAYIINGTKVIVK